MCNSTDLPELEIISLLEEQLPVYKLRADTIFGYDQDDWVHTPLVDPCAALDLTTEQIEETLKYFCELITVSLTHPPPHLRQGWGTNRWPSASHSVGVMAGHGCHNKQTRGLSLVCFHLPIQVCTTSVVLTLTLVSWLALWTVPAVSHIHSCSLSQNQIRARPRLTLSTCTHCVGVKTLRSVV